jgi:hypothetical protein
VRKSAQPDPAAGTLVVTPSYKPSNKSHPWKLSVTVIANTPASSLVYQAMTEDEVRGRYTDIDAPNDTRLFSYGLYGSE